jgi:hypothetical protein
LILILGLISVSAGLVLCQPETAFGQDDKRSVKTKPPVVVRIIKQTRTKAKIHRRSSVNLYTGVKGKRKRPTLRRRVDLPKVPRLIRPAN